MREICEKLNYGFFLAIFKIFCQRTESDFFKKTEYAITLTNSQLENNFIIKKRNQNLLIHYNLEKQSERLYQLDSTWRINSIIVDKNKNIWIGTESGLYKFYQDDIVYYDKSNGLPSMPWSIQEDNYGNYMVGSHNQNVVYKLKNGKTRFEKITQKNIPKDHNFYFGAKKTKKNEIVLPTSKGVYLYKNNKFTSLDDSSGVFKYSSCYFISHTDTLLDDIAIGGVNRFIVYDWLRNVKGYLLREDIDPQDKFKDKDCLNILEVEKINPTIYFLGLNVGYILYDISTKKVITYSFYKQDSSSTINSYYSTVKDKYGTLWCAAKQDNKHGLYKYDSKEGTFNQVFENLLSEIVETIEIVNNGKILLASTPTSLVAIDLDKYYKKEGNYFFVLNQHNGFEAIEPAQNSLTQDSKGNILCLTGDEKLYKFKLDSSVFDLPKHEVSTGKVEFFDKLSFAWLAFDKSLSDTLVFEKEIRSLRFRMNAITQNAPENLVYVFRFKKGNKEWSEWQETDAYFALPDFPAGASQLQVACYYFFDSEKLEGKPIKTFCLVFKPFWYEKLWVQISGTLVILSLVGISLYLFVRNRNKGILLRQNFEIMAKQKEEIESQNNVLAATNEELQTKQETIEETNKQLIVAKEEIETQNQHLMDTNKELQTQKEKIKKSNEEISWLKNNLEHDLGNDLDRLKELGEINIQQLNDPIKINHFENLQSSLLATVDYYAFMTKLEKEEKEIKDLLYFVVINILKKYNKEKLIEIKEPYSNLDANHRKERKAIHKAIVCIAELVRNTTKYAFPTIFLQKSSITPTIQIEVVKEENFVFIRYQDNGIGIPEKNNKENQKKTSTGIGFLLLQDTSDKEGFIWKNKDEGGLFVQLKLKIRL